MILILCEELYELLIKYELRIKFLLFRIILVLFVFKIYLLHELFLFLAPFNKLVQNSIDQFEVHKMHRSKHFPEELVTVRKFDFLLAQVLIVILEPFSDSLGVLTSIIQEVLFSLDEVFTVGMT